jgi:hypothetical protein
LLRQPQTQAMLVELTRSSLQDPITLKAVDGLVKNLLQSLLSDPHTMQQLVFTDTYIPYHMHLLVIAKDSMMS